MQLLLSALTWPGSRWSLASAAETADVLLGTRAEQTAAAAPRRMKTGRSFLKDIATAVDLDLSGGTV